MSFFSLTFLFLALPICLMLYYCIPNRLKNSILLIISLVFYYFMDADNLPLILCCVSADYILSACIRYGYKIKGLPKAALFLSVLKTILLLLHCVTRFTLNQLEMPIGILVYPLSSLSFVIDLYRGEIQFERNPVDFFLYNCFFGKIVIGPFARYTIIRPQLKCKRISLSSISSGMVLLIQGIAKKVIVSDNLMAAYFRIQEIETRDITLLSSWLLIITLALGVYFTLSAYCDVARGLGQMLNFKLPRNIYYPLHTRQVREMVSRLNTTYYEFLKKYVYVSLGAGQYGLISKFINMSLFMMLYGIWFGVNPSCLFLGECLALLILGEKYWYGKYLKAMPVMVSRLYTYAVLAFSFCFISNPTLTGAFRQIRLLFHFKHSQLSNEAIIYILTQNYWVILLGVLFSYPLLPKWIGFLNRKSPFLMNAFAVGFNIGLLVLTVMFIL